MSFSPSHISVSKSCEAPSERLRKQLPSHTDVARFRLSIFSCSSIELLQSCRALNRRGFYAFLLLQNARDHTTFTSAERASKQSTPVVAGCDGRQRCFFCLIPSLVPAWSFRSLAERRSKHSYKRSPSRRFFCLLLPQNARDHTTFTSAERASKQSTPVVTGCDGKQS